MSVTNIPLRDRLSYRSQESILRGLYSRGFRDIHGWGITHSDVRRNEWKRSVVGSILVRGGGRPGEQRSGESDVEVERC